MPSWDRTRFRIGECVEPGNDRVLTNLVDATLSQFPEICGLKEAARDELVRTMVEAIQFHRSGFAPKRPESSGAGSNRRIFVTSVEAALRRAALATGNTRN